MEVNPKYSIGQAVYFKSEVMNYNNEEHKDKFTRKPNSMIIIERIIQECIGGIQYTYNIRMYTERGSILQNFNEVELTDTLTTNT